MHFLQIKFSHFSSATKKSTKNSLGLPRLQNESNFQDRSQYHYHQAGADISTNHSDGAISALIVQSTAHGSFILFSFFLKLTVSQFKCLLTSKEKNY